MTPSSLGELAVAHALDFLALAVYGACWFGYMHYAERRGRAGRNLIDEMSAQRRIWMRAMMGRDNRMLDIQIVRSAVQSAQFFASTSILVVAGLLTMLGASDTAIQVVDELPFAEATSRTLWELKVLLLVFVFVYAFFKFMWSVRQYNYCAVLIGGAPALDALPDDIEESAEDLAWIATLAAKHSNHGTRAYYFGFALLAWFLHPLAVIPASFWVVAVIWRRKHRSQTLARLATLAGRNES